MAVIDAGGVLRGDGEGMDFAVEGLGKESEIVFAADDLDDSGAVFARVN